MQDLEKLVDVAVDLRIATLKAREQGIISYTKEVKGAIPEAFQIFDEQTFREMLKNREYTIEINTPLYQYTTKIAGLNFMCLTAELLFEGDEDKIEDRL